MITVRHSNLIPFFLYFDKIIPSADCCQKMFKTHRRTQTRTHACNIYIYIHIRIYIYTCIYIHTYIYIIYI